MNTLLPKVLSFLNKSFGTYTVRGWEIEPTYWQAGAIIILIFLLIITLARLRYIYIEWHFNRQNISFLFYGFLLALILEGFLVISGRTFFTATLGWKNAPKPISAFIDFGRNKLTQVLGSQTQIPSSVAKGSPTAKSVMSDYLELSAMDAKSVQRQVCSQ